MNTGQTMLVIAAFALLATVTLAINATMIGTATTGLEMEANLNALSIGQALLDEIINRYFDENVTPLPDGTTRRVMNASGMTLSQFFGADGVNETITGISGANGIIDSSRVYIFQSQRKFDDVDDYHRWYKRWVWDDRLEWFKVSCTITYIAEENPNTTSASRTFQKRIDVHIENPSLPKNLQGEIIIYKLSDIAIYRRYY